MFPLVGQGAFFVILVCFLSQNQELGKQNLHIPQLGKNACFERKMLGKPHVNIYSYI